MICILDNRSREKGNFFSNFYFFLLTNRVRFTKICRRNGWKLLHAVYQKKERSIHVIVCYRLHYLHYTFGQLHFFFIPCKFFDKAHIYKQIRRCECQPFSKKYFIQRVQFEDLVLKSVIDYSESENMNCVFLEKVRYIFF